MTQRQALWKRCDMQFQDVIFPPISTLIKYSFFLNKPTKDIKLIPKTPFKQNSPNNYPVAPPPKSEAAYAAHPSVPTTANHRPQFSPIITQPGQISATPSSSSVTSPLSSLSIPSGRATAKKTLDSFLLSSSVTFLYIDSASHLSQNDQQVALLDSESSQSPTNSVRHVFCRHLPWHPCRAVPSLAWYVLFLLLLYLPFCLDHGHTCVNR